MRFFFFVIYEYHDFKERPRSAWKMFQLPTSRRNLSVGLESDTVEFSHACSVNKPPSIVLV